MILSLLALSLTASAEPTETVESVEGLLVDPEAMEALGLTLQTGDDAKAARDDFLNTRGVSICSDDNDLVQEWPDTDGDGIPDAMINQFAAGYIQRSAKGGMPAGAYLDWDTRADTIEASIEVWVGDGTAFQQVATIAVSESDRHREEVFIDWDADGDLDVEFRTTAYTLNGQGVNSTTLILWMECSNDEEGAEGF